MFDFLSLIVLALCFCLVHTKYCIVFISTHSVFLRHFVYLIVCAAVVMYGVWSKQRLLVLLISTRISLKGVFLMFIISWWSFRHNFDLYVGDERCNVIMWMDHRAVSEAEAINSTHHPLLRSVGGRISLEMQLPKLLWLKKVCAVH